MYLALRKRLSSNGFDHHDLQSCDRGDIATDFFSQDDVYMLHRKTIAFMCLVTPTKNMSDHVFSLILTHVEC